MGFKSNQNQSDSLNNIFNNITLNKRINKSELQNNESSPTGKKLNFSENDEKIGKIGHVPFFGYLRASVGAGVSLTLSPAVTLEVTYAVPLLKSSHDVTKPFQLGVGISLS